jgi:O-antigen ligase
MSSNTRAFADPRLAFAAVLLCGCGAVLGLSGAANTQLVPAAIGGAALAVGLTVILTAGWVDALVVLLCALPLPALYSSASARLGPALVLTMLFIFARIAAAGLERRILPLDNAPFVGIATLTVALMAATLFAEERGGALRELVNWGILFSFLLIVTAELSSEPQRVHRLALVIAALIGVCGVGGVLQTVGILPAQFARPGTSLMRATLGFGWPNEGGMFMAVGLPFTVYAFGVAQSRGQRALALAGVAAAVCGLAATFSRGSWLAVLVAPTILFFTGQRRFVVRVWIAALLAAVLIDVVSGGAIRDRIASTIGDWVLEQRVALTYAGVVMFLDHPFVGVGPGGFATGLEQYGPSVTWLWDYLPTAQNAYVQMAAEAGLVGLFGLLVFLGSGVRALLVKARRQRVDPTTTLDEMMLQRTLLWSFLTACLLGFAEWPFAHGVGQLILVVAAMGYARSRTVVVR